LRTTNQPTKQILPFTFQKIFTIQAISGNPAFIHKSHRGRQRGGHHRTKSSAKVYINADTLLFNYLGDDTPINSSMTKSRYQYRSCSTSLLHGAAP
jgi:hypothetical protein